MSRKPAPSRRKGRKAPRPGLGAALAPTCGQSGGVGRDGRPCGQPPAVGQDDGLCVNHGAEAVARLQVIKKAVVEALASGTVSVKSAAEQQGKDQATIWRWRQADPEFDAAFVAARASSDVVRVGMVEDTMFARIVAGKASPAETIFFLKNRAPDRWKDRVEHTGADGGAIAFTLDITTPIRPTALNGRVEREG